MSKRTVWISLVIILAFGAVLRLWNLVGPDIIADDALYSFRAVGAIDYIASTNTQTTPVIWFDEPQWWQRLSFHDAPPLVFLIQRLFFAIGGVNAWAARLPFVIAGLLAVGGMFFLGRHVAGSAVAGLLAALTLAVANHHVWISRIGFLDGFVALWIILASYFFLKARENPRAYLLWGMSVAGGLLSKYTFLFMGPVFLLHLLMFERRAWRSRWLYCGIAAMLVLLLPVILYNVMMWKTRGHVDAALSTLIGAHPADFFGLSRAARTVSASSALAVAQGIARNMSAGFAAVLLLGLGILGYRTATEPKRRPEQVFVWSALFWAIVMLMLVGGGGHFAVIVLPFTALVAGAGIAWFSERGGRVARVAIALGVAAVMLWETVFAAQSQLMAEPIVRHPLLAAKTRPAWHGYAELERYVADFYRRYPDPSYVIFSKTPQIFAYQQRKLQAIYRETPEPPPQQSQLLAFDDRMEWFASVWIFERRRLYNVAAIPSLTNLLQAIDEDYLDKFNEFGFTDVTIMLATDAIPHETRENAARLSRFAAALRREAKPAEVIRNAHGAIAFEVFKFPLDRRALGVFREAAP